MNAWRQMVDEHAQLEILELQDRVKDLEQERDVCMFWFKQTLHALHDMVTEHDQFRDKYHAALEEIRSLSVERRAA